MQFLTLSIEIFLGLLWILLTVKGEPDWRYDIVEVNTINNTPDLLEISLDLKRISRGQFVLAGIFTIGVDLTDETLLQADVFYSPMGQHFVRTPFNIPKITLSQYFNTFYKDLLLDSFNECSTNPPLKDKSETFVPPWKKGVLVLENCNMSNENMPSHLRPGYYNVTFTVTNQVDTMITILVLIEPK